MLFDQKKVVVTGAGRGIGRQMAERFAREGAVVLVHYSHSQPGAEEVVASIKQNGGKAFLCQADLTKVEEIEYLAAEAHRLLGFIDVWINNAGASANTSETLRLSDDERFERMLNVDVLGTWRCYRSALPYLQRGSSVINIGWDHAIDGSPGTISQIYAAGKAAVMALTRCFAQELAPNVRVNCIAPGWIENNWVMDRPENFRQKIQLEIPMHRWGTATDIVEAALFLASPAASFITGQILVVDGGVVMR